MKDRKKRVEMFSFYDHTGIEAHLQRMAGRGWLLDKIGAFGWEYRRIEPKELTFCVCYFSKASGFDPEPSEDQETFYDLCRHTGWTLAASSAQMQIFYNEREDPVPIETDPVLEVEAIHRSAKKSFLSVLLLELFVVLMNAAILSSRLLADPVRVLADDSTLFLMVCWPALLTICAVELGSYHLWHRRAKRAAEHGQFLETSSRPWLQWGVLCTVTFAFALWAASVATSGRTVETAVIVLLLLGTAVIILVTDGIRRLLKRRKEPAKVSRLVTMLVCGALSILLTVGVVFGALRVLTGSQRSRPGSEDEAPLTVEDLLDEDVRDYEQIRSGSRSLLLDWSCVYQYPRRDVEGWDDRLGLEYTVTLVKAPFLYGLCREKALEERDELDDDRVPQGYKEFWGPVDPGPWGAAEAYRLTAQDGGPLEIYLLCYEDRIVDIRFEWPPAPEQMAMVGEKLGG